MGMLWIDEFGFRADKLFFEFISFMEWKVLYFKQFINEILLNLIQKVGPVVHLHVQLFLGPRQVPVKAQNLFTCESMVVNGSFDFDGVDVKGNSFLSGLLDWALGILYGISNKVIVGGIDPYRLISNWVAHGEVHSEGFVIRYVPWLVS